MTRTIYAEARGEGDTGMRAVAHTIMNRLKRQGWMGKTIAEVCLKPYQYSAWNDGTPSPHIGFENSRFRRAARIALEVIDSDTDITHGATHYHRKDVSPSWAQGKVPIYVYRNHIFYIME